MGPNRKAIEDLSWDVPFGQTIYNFFVREGEAVKHGWLAVLIFVGITAWATHSWTKSGVEDEKSAITNDFSGQIRGLNGQIDTLHGQLQEVKSDRDKYQMMLSPFQAAALKIYTNEPLQGRLDLLAEEVNGLARDADLQLVVNGVTNLLETQASLGSQITVSNTILLSNHDITIGLANLSRYAAIKATIDFAAQLDATNLDMPGWISQPDERPDWSHWGWSAERSIPQYFQWHAATIHISTNYNFQYFRGQFIVASDNSKTRSIWINFAMQPPANKGDTNIVDTNQ